MVQAPLDVKFRRAKSLKGYFATFSWAIAASILVRFVENCTISF